LILVNVDRRGRRGHKTGRQERQGQGRMNWKLLIVVVVLGAWGAIYFTSSGVLVGSSVTDAQKPQKGDKLDSTAIIGALSQIASGGKVLECRYFTGTGIVTRVEPYDENGTFGSAVCPRFVRLDRPRR
jgi:hypothetical protein